MDDIAVIVLDCGMLFKGPANIVGPSCIWFEIMVFGRKGIGMIELRERLKRQVRRG